MQAAEMRPLSVGEILDVAIKIYWRNAPTLFRVVLVVVAPVQAISALILASAIPDPELLQPSFTPTQEQVVVTDDELWAFLAGIAVIVVLTILASLLATGACFKAIADAYLGEKPHWKTSLAFAGRRLHSVLWISILAWVLAGGVVTVAILATIVVGAAVHETLLLLMVPLSIAAVLAAVWLWMAWIVAVPAFFTEGVKGRRALGRSFKLVRGRWWRTFGMYVLASLLAGIVTQLISSAFTAVLFTDLGESVAANVIVNSAGQTVAGVIVTPFTAAFIIVLYFDLRVRKEGFDLQLLAERVGISPGALSPATGSYLPPSPEPTAEAPPPFWPPPPGWTPSPPSVPPAPGAPPEASPQAPEPPFWPPPPGWEPGGRPSGE